MNISILYFLLFLSITACNENKHTPPLVINKQVKEKRQTSPLIALRSKFKYIDLKSFKTDTSNWDTRVGVYQELDSNTFKLVWQDGKRNFVGQGYDRDYFYSWQKRNPELIEIVILTQDESNWCDLLHYCIYDKNGKAIDNFIVAASCADGGWEHMTTGKFISKDTYERVSTDFNNEIVDAGNTKNIIEGDSIVTHFTIGINGKVTEREISKSHFRDVE